MDTHRASGSVAHAPEVRPALPVVFLLLSPALSTNWANPTPRLFSNAVGPVTYDFKVLPHTGGRFDAATVGELFELEPHGNTRCVWRGPLRNHPHEVLVASTGMS